MSDQQDLETKKISAWEKWQLPAMQQSAASNTMSVKQMDSIHEQAYQEGLHLGSKDGFEQGYQKGLCQGLSDASDQINKQSTQLSYLIESLQKQIADQDQHLKQTVTKIIKSLCKKIIYNEIQTTDDFILQKVEQLIDKIPPGYEFIKIHLNPEDYSLVKESLQKQNKLESNWQLVQNKQIAQFNCIVESDLQVLDGVIDNQIQALLEENE